MAPKSVPTGPTCSKVGFKRSSQIPKPAPRPSMATKSTRRGPAWRSSWTPGAPKSSTRDPSRSQDVQLDPHVGPKSLAWLFGAASCPQVGSKLAPRGTACLLNRLRDAKLKCTCMSGRVSFTLHDAIDRIPRMCVLGMGCRSS